MFVLLSLSLSLSLKILLLTLPPSPFIRSDSCDEWGGGRDTPSPPPFPSSNSPFPSPPDDAGRMKDILKTGDYYRFKLDLKSVLLRILQGRYQVKLFYIRFRFDQSYEPMPPSKPASEGVVNFRQKKEEVLGLDGHRFIEPIYQGQNGRPLESQRFSGQIYAEHR